MMVTSDRRVEVDLSPILVSKIMVDGRRLVAREPVCYEVVFEDDDVEPLYTLEGEFDVILAAPTRKELEIMLDDEFVFLWQLFAQADSSQLSPGAAQLGEDLRNRFADAAEAAQVA